VTARSYAIWSIYLLYSGTATSVALIAAGFATWTCPRHGVPIFLGVFVALAVAAVLAGSRKLRDVEQAWDARWDEHGRSWAVLEAERIAERATQP
jgi:membrane protein implicated in regulation of membrane protease activity